MRFRRAAVQDVEVAVDLVTAMLREMAGCGGRDLNEEQRVADRLHGHFLDVLEDEDHLCLFGLAKGAGEPVGIVEAGVRHPHDIFRPTSVMHVRALYVEPRYRGEGRGRRLLEEALSWGRDKGCTEATLSVLAGNTARMLYERMGFEAFELEMRLRL